MLAAWDKQLGPAPGEAVVWSEGTSHLLAPEPPSRLGERHIPSAHTSAMGSGVPPASPTHLPATRAAAFAGVPVSRHGHSWPCSVGRQGSTAARKGPKAN